MAESSKELLFIFGKMEWRHRHPEAENVEAENDGHIYRAGEQASSRWYRKLAASWPEVGESADATLPDSATATERIRANDRAALQQHLENFRNGATLEDVSFMNRIFAEWEEYQG